MEGLLSMGFTPFSFQILWRAQLRNPIYFKPKQAKLWYPQSFLAWAEPAPSFFYPSHTNKPYTFWLEAAQEQASMLLTVINENL